MKYVSIAILLSFLFCINSVSIGQSWYQKNATFQSINGSGVSLNNNGFLFGGLSNGSFSNSVFKYDVNLDSIISMNNFLFSARADGIGMENNGVVYFGLGWDGSSTFNDLYRYYPTTDSWALIFSNYPGSGGRNSFFGSSANDIYVGGGTVGSTTPYSNQFWRYNIQSSSWVNMGFFPLGSRAGGVSITLDSIIYMGMGHDGTTTYNDLYGFNTKNNSWFQVNGFPGLPRTKPAFFVINDKIIIGGGFQLNNGSNPLNDYYIYNTTSGLWSSTPILTSIGISNGQFFNVANMGYLISGRTTNSVISNQVFSLDIITNIKSEINNENLIELYPNPAIDIININRIEDGRNILKVYDINGVLVLNQLLNSSNSNVSIDVKQLVNGIYIYKIFGEQKIFQGKFSVHR